MKAIYALQGPQNSGKTETLVLLYKELQRKYPDLEIKLINDGGDIKAIISIALGQSIGIESQGDPNSRLKQSLQDFHVQNCSLIFCACRTKGMTVEWVNSLSHIYTIHYVAKTISSDGHQQANLSDAHGLINLAGL